MLGCDIFIKKTYLHTVPVYILRSILRKVVFPSVVNMTPSPRKEKKAKISSTSKTVMENGHIDNSDDTETLIGSQFGQQKNKRNKDLDYGSDINGLSDLSMLGLPAENVSLDDGNSLFIQYFSTNKNQLMRYFDK